MTPFYDQIRKDLNLAIKTAHCPPSPDYMLIWSILLVICCWAEGKCKAASDCPSRAPCCSRYGYCGNGEDYCAPAMCRAGCWSKDEYKKFLKSGLPIEKSHKALKKKHKKQKKGHKKHDKGLRRTKL